MTETVYFLSSARILGGAERSLTEIAGELRARRRRCVLVSPAGSRLEGWAAETGTPHEALEIGPLPWRAPRRLPGELRRYRRAARDLTARHGPGVLYSNTRHAFIVLATLPGAHPKVAHHRDVVSRPVNRLLYPRIDRNLFVSRFNFEHSDRPANGRVILNAGALDRDDPPVLPEAAGPLRLAMFARITAYKGHDLALEASARLRADGIAHRVDIWGEAGERPQDVRHRDRLEARAAEADLPVAFRGFHPAPARAMRDYHCILNPSLDEPFGRIPVEGFSLGVPVISHASGGSLEIYAGLDDYRPYLFEARDGAGLAAAIADLARRGGADRDAEAARLERIRADVRRRFSVGRVVDEIEEVLAEVLAARGRAWPSALEAS